VMGRNLISKINETKSFVMDHWKTYSAYPREVRLSLSSQEVLNWDQYWSILGDWNCETNEDDEDLY